MIPETSTGNNFNDQTRKEGMEGRRMDRREGRWKKGTNPIKVNFTISTSAVGKEEKNKQFKQFSLTIPNPNVWVMA